MPREAMSDQPTTNPPIPGPDADAAAAWSRVQGYLDKLSDAPCDLDEAGGIAGVAASQGWRPGKIDAARAKFRALRDQLDAGEFACDHLEAWWDDHGRLVYPEARSILLLRDGGGSNSARHYLFKEDLQRLVDKLQVEIRVAH